MIRVRWGETPGGGLRLGMAGHAGAPVNLEGHDLVCAAASILCLTLARAAERFCESPAVVTAPGRAQVAGTPRPGAEAAFAGAWQGILMGFELLQEAYPLCLEVIPWT